MMKNILIRFTSISIILLMLAALTSCDEKAPTSSSSTQESKAEVPVADFKGGTVLVASWVDAAPELGKSTGEDALYHSFEQAMEKFNCDIEWYVTARSDHFSKVVSNSLSGTVYADIIMSHSWNHVGLINQNILIKTDKYLDLMTEEERSNWMTDMCYFKGHYYGLHPKSRVVLPALNLFYNRTILDELKLQDPQEHALAGTWNWETFYDYCIAATDPAKNRYGSTIFNLDAVLGAANGVETVVFDENDGKYYNGFTHTESQYTNLDVVEFIWKLAQNGALLGLWPHGPEAMDDAENGFLDGQALFTYAQNGERLKTLGMDNFGVVTAPIADFNESKTLYNTTASFVYWAIPSKTTYPADDLAEFWMYAQTTWDESRGDAYYKFDLDEYRELLLSMSYTDMKDVDFLLAMRDGVIEKPSLDLAISLGSLVARDIFAEVVAGNMTPSAAIATVDNQIQAKIDEALNIN